MKNLKYLISALTLGAALAAPGMSYGEDAAAASDNETSRKVLSEESTPNTSGADAVTGSSPASGKKDPDSQKKQEAVRNTAPALLPENCTLISYTKDGVFTSYRCPEHDLMGIVIEPKNNLTRDLLIENLVTSGDCTKQEHEDYIYGQRLSCRNGDESYDAYVGKSPTGLLVMLTADSSYNYSVVLSALQNLTLTIYFFQRHVAKDQEQIDYLNGLMEKALPARDAMEMNDIRMKSKEKKSR